MNYGPVIRFLGNLFLIEGALLSVPLGISLYYGEQGAVLAFLLTMGILSILGLFASNFPASSARLKTREAILIVALGWLCCSFMGSLPFVFSKSAPNLIDAFFETVSGLTTTGATVIENVEVLPMGILFWRSFTHWLGGMGILVLSLAVLPTFKMGGLQVFKAESPGPSADKLAPRLAVTTKILYTVYLTITIMQVLVFFWGGFNWFESFVFTFGAVGTGGFSIYNDSLARFGGNTFLISALACGMLLSGVNFSLYYDLWRRRWQNVRRDSELRLYLSIAAAAVLLVTFNLYGQIYSEGSEAFKQALFQVSSVMTTTGYSTVDYDLWPTFSKAVLFLLMFVGGSAGSTAGSVKVIRLLIAGKAVRREVFKTLHAQAVTPITVNGRILPEKIVTGVAAFYFLYFAVFALGTLLISLEGLDLISSMSAVASTLGNIGPGLGAVGPTKTFAGFSWGSKLLFSFLMLLGRLELFTLLMIVTPSFWRK